jgi:hypothetical protein
MLLGSQNIFPEENEVRKNLIDMLFQNRRNKSKSQEPLYA